MPITITETADNAQELLKKVARTLGFKVQAPDGAIIYDPAAVPAAAREPISMDQLWSLGPNGETLFMGARFDTELAERYKFLGTTIYMLGKDGLWRRAAAKSWVKLAKPDQEPMSEADR